MTSPYSGNHVLECGIWPRRWRFSGHFCQRSADDSQQTPLPCRCVEEMSSSAIPLPIWHGGCFRQPLPHAPPKETIPMMKLSLGLLVAATTSVLSGCALYFGEDHDDDTWTYCGSDGYYSCEDEDCQWVSATCPDPGWGSGGGSSGGGFDCTDNNDCAAGC